MWFLNFFILFNLQQPFVAVYRHLFHLIIWCVFYQDMRNCVGDGTREQMEQFIELIVLPSMKTADDFTPERV